MEISSSAIHVHGTLYTNLSLPSSLRFPLSLPSNSLRHLASLPSRASISTRRLFLVAPRSLSDDAAAVVQQKAIEVVNDLKGTSLFLVGMNSPMKEKIGKVIAEVLRYYYFDSDGLVEEAAGYGSSGTSFRERDEDGFRESETEVLRQLSSMGRLIVNAGNGAVQSATNLSLLRHGISIWIDIPLDMIAMEYIEDSNQKPSSPELSSELLSKLTAVYQENNGGYATADACISLLKVASNMDYDEYHHVTAEDMALEVLKEIEKLTRVKKKRLENHFNCTCIGLYLPNQ